MLFDAGAHFTDMMLHVFGPVAEVDCDMRKSLPINSIRATRKAAAGRRDTWLGTLRFESGFFAHWELLAAAFGTT